MQALIGCIRDWMFFGRPIKYKYPVAQVVPLQLWTYSRETENWTHYPCSLDDEHNTNKYYGELKIGTYNVLYDGVRYAEWVLRSPARYAHQVDLLEHERFHILVLNEVTDTFMKLILNSAYFRENYVVSSMIPELTDEVIETPHARPLGNMLLIHKSISNNVEMYSYEFNIVRGRPSHIAILTIPVTEDLSVTSRICIVGSHLKAIASNVEIRRQQFKELESLILNDTTPLYRANYDELLHLGDLNLHSEEEQELIDPEKFLDVHLDYFNENPDPDQYYTFDCKRNTMIKCMLIAFKARMRLDRILQLRTSNNRHHLTCSHVSLFGTRSIGWLLWPSDHFGIKAKFTVNHNSIE